MVNATKKGGRHEREVAKLWHDWSGYEFARTPQSGGLHWKKAHTSGDIVCIDDSHGVKFPFSIECKFYEELLLLPLIQGLIGKKSNKIWEFWVQSYHDALQSKKIPLVFMRKNGMKKGLNFVMMSDHLFKLWLSILERVNGQGWDTQLGYISYYNVETAQTLVIINSFELMKTDYLIFYKAGRKLKRHDFNNEV